MLPAPNKETIDTTNLRYQCAWCLRIQDRDGNYTIQADHKILTLSHGICPADAKEFLES